MQQLKKALDEKKDDTQEEEEESYYVNMIQTLKDYIELNFAGEITLETISGEVGMNPAI